MKVTGTATVTCAPAPTRMKSTCNGRSLIGWYWTSRGKVRCVAPSTLMSASVAKNPGLANARANWRGSRLISTGSWLSP